MKVHREQQKVFDSITPPENPYLVGADGGWHTLNVSGGRTSGYLFYQVLQAYDFQLPDNVIPVFCNTGKEMPQTLAFLAEMERRWGVDLVWLEYYFNPDARGGRADPKHCARVVNADSAATHGEPFQMLIESRRYLPNQAERICTQELKVETIKRYLRRVRGIPTPTVKNALGIRYDEPKRWYKALMEECQSEYPLVLAKVTAADVLAFWRKQPFNLNLPESGYLGNCDMCFLKGKANLRAVLRYDPSLVDWWIRMEEFVRARTHINKPEMNRFRITGTYQDLVAEQEFDFSSAAAEDEDVSCFCTD